jgi:hypothetical protein
LTAATRSGQAASSTPVSLRLPVGATAEDDGQQVGEGAGQHLQGKADHDGRNQPVDPLVEIDDL